MNSSSSRGSSVKSMISSIGKQNPGHNVTIKVGVVFLFLLYLVNLSKAEISRKIGLNYGRIGDNLPSPYQSIQIIKSLKAARVKLYDVNPEILRLLAGTNIQVSIMVTNSEIVSIASNQTVANNWVRDNVLQHYPKTMIRFIQVGNEVLSFSSDKDRVIWIHLVPAMRRIKNSLKAYNIHKIKISTPLAMDVMQNTFPPSKGTFHPDVTNIVMKPLLKFLNDTKSFFSIDVYPYFPWSASPTTMDLDFTLFRSNVSYTDPGSGLIYTNLLDQMLDSLIFAMSKLGYPHIHLLISETGWPNAGDIDQPGANIHNAATYNRNLIKRVTSKPTIGTPARPGVVIPTFIFSLYDENQKAGPGTERHWGMMHPDGKPIYEIDLTGKQPASNYKPLPKALNNRPYKGKVWCVAVGGANLNELEAAVTSVCNQGNGTCEALAQGKGCNEPWSAIRRASYAFSWYWEKFRSQGATCYFNGLAEQTTRDPSHGSCTFPSVTF